MFVLQTRYNNMMEGIIELSFLFLSSSIPEGRQGVRTEGWEYLYLTVITPIYQSVKKTQNSVLLADGLWMALLTDSVLLAGRLSDVNGNWNICTCVLILFIQGVL